MNKIMAWLATILLITAVSYTFVRPADATDESCVPKDAIPAQPAVPAVPGTPAIPGTPAVPAVPPVTEEVTTYQHYSWTGGNRNHDDPPTVTPPHEDWQANTKSEPHDSNGNPATWVNDSLHYTANSEHSASWFYLETKTETVVVTPGTPEIPAVPGTPEIPGTPAIPAVPAVPAVVCPEVQEPEVQEPEVQEPEVQEPEVQEPEVNGPKNAPVPSVQSIVCKDGVWVTLVNGKAVGTSGSCEPTQVNAVPQPAMEEGL